LKPCDLIQDLEAIGPLEPSALFFWLADHMHVARLKNGMAINDGLDCAELFRQLGVESQHPQRSLVLLPKTAPASQPRNWKENR